ncbi:MAG: hypothetical protein KGN01_06200 [Patescibacteria group bacterium]|nr:hypothetical protein [Patescibacteria group bacterium]
MLNVGSGWRAFFAPFDYVAVNNALNNIAAFSVGPAVLDLMYQGPFNSNNPPAGYNDCGWLKDVKITDQTKIGQVTSGYRGAVAVQYRGQIGDQVAFKFREFGRLQYKLAVGTQVYNLLQTGESAPASSPLAAPGFPSPAIAMGASGYMPSGAVAGYVGRPTVFVPAGSGAAFYYAPFNNYIVVDIDTPTTIAGGGIFGENGAFAFPNSVNDIDWVRKTSDFVARTVALVPNAAAGQDALILDQPFVGGGAPASTNGTPPSTSKVQLIKGWTVRTGGTFIQEWSGLFIADTIDGAQTAVWFPHLSISQFQGINSWAIDNIGTTDLSGWDIETTMQSLAYTDLEDGETVTSYTMFYPGGRQQNLY